MIKIIHSSDFHLDKLPKVLGNASPAKYREDILSTFTSFMAAVKTSNPDFLLIAGDLIESSCVSDDTLSLICREFASIPDCKIIIVPGNHDPYTETNPYLDCKFPENVYLFTSSELSFFDFPESSVRIYGWAIDSVTMDHCPLVDFKVDNNSRINILIAHGELDGAVARFSIPKNRLTDCGFDYIALGHRHTHKGFEKIGDGYLAYSGCIEGRAFNLDETGEKGALFIEIDKKGSLEFNSKFVSFTKRKYTSDSLDVSGAESNSDIIKMISEHIEKNHYDENTPLSLRLFGNLSNDFKISEDYLKEQFPKLYIFNPIDDTAKS